MSLVHTQISGCHTELHISVPPGERKPEVSGASIGRKKSWLMNYSALAFLMNGQLFTEYNRISHMLGLPSCSEKQWSRIVEWLESHVTKLAQRTCDEVRKQVVERGDKDSWVVSFDGYYQTRGHYSNNSSATLHDYATGRIAWFQHRTKREPGHNWEGTSGGAGSDMFDSILGEVTKAGFSIKEIVTDKDSSVNAVATFLREQSRTVVTTQLRPFTKVSSKSSK